MTPFLHSQPSAKAHSQLRAIVNHSSTKAKQDLLASIWRNPENDTFRSVCLLALDPFITFGVNKLPKVGFGTEEFNPGTTELLDRLRNRELTGNAAKQAVSDELSRLNPYAAELFGKILTGKLGGGFTANAINKVTPDTIYLFKMCLASKFLDHVNNIPDRVWEWGVSAEIKEDGVRGVALHTKGYHIVSRNGLPLNSNEDLRSEIHEFLHLWKNTKHLSADYNTCLRSGCHLDGEMVEANEDFNDSVGSSRSQDEDRAKTLQFKVIDVLTEVEMKAKRSLDPYIIRRKRLEAFFADHGEHFPNIKLIKSFTVHSREEAETLFDEVRAKGHEGLVLKLSDGFWEQKRSKGWLKMKDVISADLIIKGVEAGDPNGKFSGTMGAVVCDYTNQAGNVVEVKIGGGFTVKQRAEIWASYTRQTQSYPVTKNGQTTTVYVEPGDCWVGSMIEVLAHEETKYGSLREPRFKCRRFDKPADEGQGC